MDDGQQVINGGVTLCTDSFKPEEIMILREALETNFNVITSIHIKKGKNNSVYQRIYINKISLKKLKPFLKHHIHYSMLYKINESTNKLKNSNIEFDIGDF